MDKRIIIGVVLIGALGFHLNAQQVSLDTARPKNIDPETWGHIVENRAQTAEEQERRFLTNRLLLRDVGITLLAAVGLLVFIAINSKRSQQQAKEKWKKYKKRSAQAAMRSIELKNELIKVELKTKESKLDELLAIIKSKNRQLEELKRRLSGKSQTEKVDILSQIGEAFNSEQEWENFRLNFEQIHNGYFDKFLAKFPTMTPYELRLAALLRLNLSSKEIGSILNISPNSVNTGRYRMRKKMNLAESDDLVLYLIKL